ncbi:hypothetical protein Hanom_Chr06g00542611 [Helianthus anomalus]
MTALLKTSCEDLILKHGYTDPKSLPQQISDIIGIRKIMHVSVRREGHIVVTNVTDLAKTNDVQGRSVGTLASAVHPTTPDPKVNINIVTNVTDLAETKGSSVGTLASAVPPTTPDPKVNINKRSHTDSPGKEMRFSSIHTLNRLCLS